METVKRFCDKHGLTLHLLVKLVGGKGQVGICMKCYKEAKDAAR